MPEKKVSFFCIRQDSGGIQWSGVGLPEPWWIGIEAVHGDLVLLHEFAVPDFPDHKKIHALDLSTGRHLWSNDESKYLFADGATIYAATNPTGEPRYLRLDAQTGRQIGETDAETLALARRRAYSTQKELVEFPAPCAPDRESEHPLWNRIEKLLRGSNRIHFAEYIEKDGFLAIGYYTSTGNDPLDPMMDHHFMIAEPGSGAVVYRDLLDAHASAAIPDAFFAIGPRVFTITEKTILKAFDLSPRGAAHG